MKQTLSLLILICSLPFTRAADSKSDFVIPRGAFNFNGVSAMQFLEMYKELSGKKLVISAHVPRAAKITLQPDRELKASEAVALMEKAVLDQAGIIVTKIDDQQVSVTYNEALPVSVVKDGKPIPIPIDKDGKPIPTPTFSPEQLRK